MFRTRRMRPDPEPGGREFTSAEVSRLSGVSLRQLQWWDERKVVSPRHEGHRRVYGPGDVVAVAVIAELRRKGFSLQKIRRVLRFLQREMNKRLGDVMNGSNDLHLVTDGRTIHLEDRESRIIDLLKHARQPMFLVCVSDQARRLTSLARKPARTEAGLARRARAAS